LKSYFASITHTTPYTVKWGRGVFKTRKWPWVIYLVKVPWHLKG